MMVNTINTMYGYRRIRISRNEIKISNSHSKTDCKKSQSASVKKKYQIINEIDLGEKHQIAQCLDRGEITIFSINECKEICKAPQTAVVNYLVVGNELFVTIKDEGNEYVYDDVGNLIEVDSENHLEVVFAGSGPCIKKTNKVSGRKNLYSFEGRLVG